MFISTVNHLSKKVENCLFLRVFISPFPKSDSSCVSQLPGSCLCSFRMRVHTKWAGFRKRRRAKRFGSRKRGNSKWVWFQMTIWLYLNFNWFLNPKKDHENMCLIPGLSAEECNPLPLTMVSYTHDISSNIRTLTFSCKCSNNLSNYFLFTCSVITWFFIII